MTRHARTAFRLLIGVLLLAPATGFAQSADPSGGPLHLRNNNWQGSYSKQALQRADTAEPVAPARPNAAPGGPVTLAQEDSQAQAPTGAPTKAAPGAAPAAPAGRVRAQGRDVTPQAPAAAVPAPEGLSLDLREQMRKFIQTISTFARRQSRNFMVLTEGGLELMVKRDPADETRIAPARAYMRSLDAIIVEGLNYESRRVFGEPPPTVRQARTLALADLAKENGLKVFVVDFATDIKSIEDSYVRNSQRGFISYAAPAPLATLNALARIPSRPFRENPNSILSMSDIRNFAYITDSLPFGRQDEFALAMHATNYDLLITNVFHGREPLTPRAVETLKYKQVGGKRLVFAVVDIGSAASYRYYWKPNWREGSPAFIGAPFREDPDRYYAQYWRPEWQRLIAGDNQSYVFGVIAQGFDGVVLTGMEAAYRFAEGGQDALDEDRRQDEQARPAPGPQAQAPAGAPATAQPGAPQPPATPAAPAPRQ